MHTPLLILDIETGPLPNVQEPVFEAPSNYKDADKIAAHIARQREQWRDELALSALTGRVMAVGLLDKDGEKILEGDEAKIVTEAFDAIRSCGMGSKYRLCGFNIHGFDLPFLVRRAWALSIIPPMLLDGRWWPSWIVDLRNLWGFYDRQAKGTLSEIGRALGLGGQFGEGRDFAKLYANPETRAEALKHLSRDLQLTQEISRRIL